MLEHPGYYTFWKTFYRWYDDYTHRKTLEKQKVAFDVGIESVSKSCVIEDVTYNKTDQSNPCVRPMLSKDEKTQNDCFMDKKPINIFPIISKRSESDVYNHHTSSMTGHDKDGLLTQITT
jgi:hypothetical protein